MSQIDLKKRNKFSIFERKKSNFDTYKIKKKIYINLTTKKLHYNHSLSYSILLKNKNLYFLIKILFKIFTHFLN